MSLGIENVMALFGYSLQVLTADFSGYTDIAIGVAMLMGFSRPSPKTSIRLIRPRIPGVILEKMAYVPIQMA